jgi:hypothetical protein
MKRCPGPAPMRGKFHDDVGIFFGRDALNGRDIRIRFI